MTIAIGVIAWIGLPLLFARRNFPLWWRAVFQDRPAPRVRLPAIFHSYLSVAGSLHHEIRFAGAQGGDYGGKQVCGKLTGNAGPKKKAATSRLYLSYPL